jgi:excisionase family DNA binding protein
MPLTRKKSAVVEMPAPGGKTIAEQIAEKRSALSLQEFAQLVGISYRTVFDMASDGRLPVMRIGSSLRLDPKTTAEWVRERTSA